jgi:hypothetical protein
MSIAPTCQPANSDPIRLSVIWWPASRSTTAARTGLSPRQLRSLAALVAKDKTFWHNAILRGALFKLRAAMRTSLYPFGSLRGRYTIFPNLMHLGSTRPSHEFAACSSRRYLLVTSTATSRSPTFASPLFKRFEMLSIKSKVQSQNLRRATASACRRPVLAAWHLIGQLQLVENRPGALHHRRECTSA